MVRSMGEESKPDTFSHNYDHSHFDWPCPLFIAHTHFGVAMSTQVTQHTQFLIPVASYNNYNEHSRLFESLIFLVNHVFGEIINFVMD